MLSNPLPDDTLARIKELLAKDPHKINAELFCILRNNAEALISRLEAAEAKAAAAEAERDALWEDKDDAYRQRMHLVAALARLFPSGVRATNIEGWMPDWHGCVYIDLPTGQISYHYHTSQAHLFQELPPYTKPFDGHEKEDVHARLAALTANPKDTEDEHQP